MDGPLYLAIFCCQSASRFSSKFWQYQRLFACQRSAQEQKGWQLDSLPANSSASEPDAQQVYDVLLKMLDRWNAHDIEGHHGGVLEIA